jgi:hypothetical protein
VGNDTMNGCTETHVSEACVDREHMACGQLTECPLDESRVMCDCVCHLPFDIDAA